jgi:hypothetical protein
MRLADAIAETAPPPKANRVDVLLAKVEHDGDRAELIAMMEQPPDVWGHKQIAAILFKLTGDSVASSTVGDWRRARARGVR